MLGLQIGKDQRVELHPFVAVLEYALAGHLDDRLRTVGINRAAQKMLEEKAPRHRHFKKVALALRADTKADGACGSTLLAACAQKRGRQERADNVFHTVEREPSRRSAAPRRSLTVPSAVPNPRRAPRHSAALAPSALSAPPPTAS